MKKKNSKIASYVAATLMLFSVVVFNACTKNKKTSPGDLCLNVTCANGGICGSGTCVCPTGYTGAQCETQTATTLVHFNGTHTPVTITINGVTKTIAVGGSTAFTGANGSPAIGTASTSIRTTSGALVGLEMTWTISRIFLSSSQNVELNVPNTYFFLQAKNTSATPIAKVYVNYGLTAQTLDNVTLPNDAQTYNMGYYLAFSNSNVRLENASGAFALFTSLPFTGQNNQGIIVTVN